MFGFQHITFFHRVEVYVADFLGDDRQRVQINRMVIGLPELVLPVAGCVPTAKSEAVQYLFAAAFVAAVLYFVQDGFGDEFFEVAQDVRKRNIFI